MVRWGVRLGRTRTELKLWFMVLVQRLFAFSVSQQLLGSCAMQTGEEGWLQYHLRAPQLCSDSCFTAVKDLLLGHGLG